LCFKSQPQLIRMFSCNDCRGEADKNTDTVKIDFERLQNAGEKENVAPQLPSAVKHSDALDKKKQEMNETEERKRREQEYKEEQEREQREEELTKEKERHLEKQRELMRRLAEEEQRRLGVEKRIAEEQRQLQLEAEKRQDEERRRQEEERLQAEAKARAEKEEKQAKLHGFLTSAGFKAVHEQKKKAGIVTSGFTYPLHEAVKANNLEAVQLLIWAGADQAQKNSSKLTPAALAKKLNKKDSHKAILAALGE